MYALEVDHLTKVYRVPQRAAGIRGALGALLRPRFQERMALSDVSLRVEQGEMLGYIGVNGAGKSTTIKLLTGIITPTRGSVRVLGRDPHRARRANAQDIGVVFGQRTQLWWDLALSESLGLLGRIYGMSRSRYQQVLDEYVAALNIEPLLSQPVRTMSLGQRMRAELAATFLHEPKIVYLDEPTIGLDVLVKERIRAFIRQQNEVRGVTVVLTTHDLSDVEELCHRVLILDQGRLLYDGTAEALKNRFGAFREVSVQLAAPMVESFSLEHVEVAAQDDDRRLTLRFARGATTAGRIMTELIRHVEVVDFTLTEPDLATVVKQIYRNGLGEF